MPSPSPGSLPLPPPMPASKPPGSAESPGSPGLRAVRTRIAQAAAPRSRGHARGKSKGSGGNSSNNPRPGPAPGLAPAPSSSSGWSAPSSGSHVPVSSIFKKVELIGRGAYGAVYKGRHLPTDTPVALKVVNLDTPEDDAQDIQQEVALLSQLKDATAHNVIKYWGCWMRGPEVWIVMDLAEGGSIRTLMKPGPIPERLSALVVRESLIALAWLHRQGVIHRDIKAANLLLTNSGKIMLCDFGVAANLAWSGSNYRPAGAGDAHDHKDYKHPRGNYATALGALTRAADKAGHKEVQFHNQKEPVRDTSAQDAGWKRTTMIGTPYWMAPEVIVRGALYDQSADVWSLGITIWEMLLGNPPLASVDQARVIQMIPKNTPPRLGVDSGFSKECRELVQACLNEVPRERPTAEELSKYRWIKNTAKVPTTNLTELLTRYNSWVKQGGLRFSLIGGTNGADVERKPSKASTTSHSRDSFVYDGVESDFGWEFSSAASSTGSTSDSDVETRPERAVDVEDPLDFDDPSRTPRTYATLGQGGSNTMLGLPPPPPRANSLMHLFADENDPNTAEMPLMPPPPLGSLPGSSSITLPEWAASGTSPSSSLGSTLRPPPPIGAGAEAWSAPATPILSGVSTPPMPSSESTATLTPAPRPAPIIRAQTAPMGTDSKPLAAGFSGTGSTPFRFGGGGGAAAVPLPYATPKPPPQSLGTPASVVLPSRSQTLSPESMAVATSLDEGGAASSPRTPEAGLQTPGAGPGSRERNVPVVPGPTPASQKLMAMANATNTAGAAAVHRRGQSSFSAREHTRDHSASPSMSGGGSFPPVSDEGKFTRPARSASRPAPGSSLPPLPSSGSAPGTPTTPIPRTSHSDGGKSASDSVQRRSRTESAPEPPASQVGPELNGRPPPPLPTGRGSVHSRGTHGGSDPTSGAGPVLAARPSRTRSREGRAETRAPAPAGPVVPPPVAALDLAALNSKEEVSLALGARVEELARWLELLGGTVGGLLE